MPWAGYSWLQLPDSYVRSKQASDEDKKKLDVWKQNIKYVDIITM